MNKLRNILEQGESETLEFKESFRDDDLEIIERYGSGIHRMLDACAAAGLPEPVFEESTGGFLMAFRKPAGIARASGEATALDEAQEGAVTPQAPRKHPASTPQVLATIHACKGEKTRGDLQSALSLRDREHFRREYLNPALDAGLLELTIPDKPRSPRQKYRLTNRGRAILQTIQKADSK